MTGIGKKRLFPLILVFLGGIFFQPHNSDAQDFNLEASLSENEVFIGEQFSLKIEISGSSLRNVDLPVLPRVDGIRILNAHPSRGQSISIINGQTTTVTSYTYTLIARERGSFRIPPVRINIDGEEYSTNPLNVEVVEQRSLQAEPGQRRPDIFTEIELDNEYPIVGQQLIASLVIYFKTGIEVTSYQPSAGWRTDGFWKEQLENIEQPQAESVILGDVRYRKATLMRYALFPSRSGELTLTPFELNLGIRTQPRRNDPFGSVFGGLGTNQRRVTLETEEISLPVRRIEPPENGESIGAVGQFNINRNASVTQAYVGETIELTTTVSGEGNLPLISRPGYTFPDNFEVYSPQEETNLSRRGTTISGTRTFNDRIVPRTAGNFTIPESHIAYYNPQNQSYSYETLPAINLEIIRDPTATVADDGRNINLQVMTGLVNWQRAENNGSFSNWWVWLGFLIPLIGFVIGWHRKRLMIRLQNDAGFARAHRAWDNVEELLLKAEQMAKQSNFREVYHLLHKALTGYAADRLGLPGAGLADKEICEEIQQKTNDPELTSRLKKMLDKYANISYAPVEDQKDLETDILQTRELLKDLRARL